MLIKQIYISSKGDHEAGIFGESATIDAAGDFLIDCSSMDDDTLLEPLRDQIKKTFALMWGEEEKYITVMFDFEVEDEE